MHDLLGTLLILVSIPFTGWWFIGDWPNKGWGFMLCMLTLFVGGFLIIEDRVTEFTVERMGTIKAKVKQVTVDAKTVADLRKRVEAQSGTVNLVAKYFYS